MKSILLTVFAAAWLALAGPLGATPFQRADAGGGALAPPVMKGDYLYVGMGATLAAWNMADPDHPVLAGRTSAAPAPGPIRGLAIVGDHLYAAWSTPEATGGILIYSLAAPAQPVVVGRYDDYVLSAWKMPAGLAAADGHAYLGDSENGLFVLDTSDPLAPVTVGVAEDVHQFDAMALSGDRVLTSGSSFIGGRVVNVVDVANPAAPALAGSAIMDGGSVLRILLSDPYAIGVGNDLLVYDVSDPADITQVSATPIDLATGAMRNGEVLYLVGDGGIQVWDFANPAAPALLRTVAAPTFMPDQVAATPAGPLVLTHADRGVLLDASDPRVPTVRAGFMLPIGVAAGAVAFDAQHAYFAENSYGLASVERTSLAPVGRLDAALPPDPTQRAFEDIAVDGGRAYLAAWGYGVIVADLADPAHPVELGRFPFPFATAIEAHGDRVYVASTTNGGIFRVLDVSDPSAPVELGSLATSQTYDLAVRDDHAWLADGWAFGDGGLRVVDISNPSTPTLVGQSTACFDAGGIDVSADGATAWLACSDGSLLVYDTRDRSQPQVIASVALPGSESLPDYNVAHSVVVSGGIAFVGHEYGVDEIDVSEPAAPALLGRHATGYAVRKVERAPDGRVFAFAGEAGVFVFAPAVGDAIFADGFDAPAP